MKCPVIAVAICTYAVSGPWHVVVRVGDNHLVRWQGCDLEGPRLPALIVRPSL